MKIEKYILITGEDISTFEDSTDCIYGADGEVLFVPEELFNETYNRTATSDYILNKIDDIELIVHQSISKFLMDTSQDNPLECDIVIESPEDCGLSSLLLPRIVKAWQDPTEGWIYFQWESGRTQPIEQCTLEELIQILEGLEEI